MLSNKPIDGFRARYKLLHTVRVQDTSPAATRAVWQCEDDTGVRGIELSRDLVPVAGKLLRDNLTVLGPRILPLREQARVALNVVARRAVVIVNSWADAAKLRRLPFAGETGRYAKPTVYVPDFKKAVSHFCIHAGGRAVIDGIEANLGLSPGHTAPSRATLERWGNTSSSSIWYELKYVEAAEQRFVLPASSGSRRIAKGDRVLQIAFGSGFKCNSAVWLRLSAPPPPLPQPPVEAS